jgi:predicted nuclease of restriction endonuclease-like (RecB) superfamily
MGDSPDSIARLWRHDAMKKPIVKTDELDAQYQSIFGDVSSIIDEARQTAARSVNAVMTAAYWMIGQHIVEFEQGGKERAEYGTALVERLAVDLTERFGRGFSVRTVWQMKAFYLAWSIPQTVSAESESSENLQTASVESSLTSIASRFPLSWSAYVRLLSMKNINAREFYETEALRGGWSVRQLDRQINSQFYERTALSKNKATMLAKGQKAQPEDRVLPEEEIKDPFVLEFLDLKDEYSESDLEDALIKHLETFLMELGGDFCFLGRQKRLRVGDEWYRVDLLFYHRRLRCLVVIDLKLGKFTHADAGQMNLYLNYAREHWTHEEENPPVGLILCSQKDEAVARYSLEGLSNKVMAAEYRTTLPDEELLAAEIDRTRQVINLRAR